MSLCNSTITCCSACSIPRSTCIFKCWPRIMILMNYLYFSTGRASAFCFSINIVVIPSPPTSRIILGKNVCVCYSFVSCPWNGSGTISCLDWYNEKNDKTVNKEINVFFILILLFPCLKATISQIYLFWIGIY